MTVADIDGDGNDETVIGWEGIKEGVRGVLGTEMRPYPAPIGIYGDGGKRKASTERSYSGLVTTWKCPRAKLPFLVTRSTEADQKGNPIGGYVYFIGWNGEGYEELWKSNRLGEVVFDIQVCDPKGEGSSGLVVLYREKGRAILTKIVPAD